jgi:hypothetical protein
MILARSPHIVTIDEATQTETKIELFIWNGTGAAPALPTYVLSKKIPSTNDRTAFYDIAPYLREYFKFYETVAYTTGINELPNQYAYCNVEYKTYYYEGASSTLLDTVTDIALDGYGYYEDGNNPNEITLSRFLLSQSPNTYYYHCDSAIYFPGSFTMLGADSFPEYDSIAVEYSPLNSIIPSIVVTITQPKLANLATVHPDFIALGNKLTIIGTAGEGETVLCTYYFVPQCECKYEPITVDFINRFGAWQREWFYKASTENIEMTNTTYKTNPVAFPVYNIFQGQVGVYNTNAKRTIKANTGWVEEDYKNTMQELLLSETIRVNNTPATLKTKSLDKQKSINNKTINYTMEFEMAYDVINSVN